CAGWKIAKRSSLRPVCLLLATICQRRDLTILDALKTDDRNACAEQGHEHVRLRIPGIALGAKEFFRALPGDQRDPPFDHFVEGAERQRYAERKKAEHGARAEKPEPDQDFPRQQSRNQALHQMPELVVGIALKVEHILYPE